MTAQYTLPAVDITLIGQGRAHLPVQVHGYWSRDPITVRIQRGGAFSMVAEEGVWSAEISHSSGGRDTKVVASDIEASKNFGAALVAAAVFAEMILARSAELEAVYVAWREELAAEGERRRVARAAALEADKAIGAEAEPLLAKLIAAAKAGTDRVTTVSAAHHRRGEDRYPTYIRVEHRRHTGVTLIEVGGQRVSRAAAVAKIAELSQRTVVEPAA